MKGRARRAGPTNARKAAAVRPQPSPAPAGKINVTDPDSQLVKSLHGWVQGYTAQAAATPEQFIVAADVITSGNERSRLGPMVDQALDALAGAGIDEQPEVVSADAGFFNTGHIEQLTARGIRPLVSPDASWRKQPGSPAAATRSSRCARRCKATKAAICTGDERRSSSRSSPTPRSCAAPSASNEEA